MTGVLYIIVQVTLYLLNPLFYTAIKGARANSLFFTLAILHTHELRGQCCCVQPYLTNSCIFFTAWRMTGIKNGLLHLSLLSSALELKQSLRSQWITLSTSLNPKSRQKAFAI